MLRWESEIMIASMMNGDADFRRRYAVRRIADLSGRRMERGEHAGEHQNGREQHYKISQLANLRPSPR